jgi:hypothetical protein
MKDGFATTYKLAPGSLRDVRDDLVENFDEHLELSGSIDNTVTIVTGCTMTGDYHAVLITASERSLSLSAEAGLEPFAVGELGISLLRSRTQRVLQSSGHRHQDPTTNCSERGCDTNKNQCVFLNLIKARKRKFRGIRLKAAAKPPDLGGDEDGSLSDKDTYSGSDSSTSSTLELTNEYDKEEKVCEGKICPTEANLAVLQAPDLWDEIFEYIFSQVTDHILGECTLQQILDSLYGRSNRFR